MTVKKKKIRRYSPSSILQSVVDGYNTFAEHWNITRQNTWYEFNLFAKTIKPGDIVLDIGCGNGRLYTFLQEAKCEVEYTGIDNAKELIRIAASQHPTTHFMVADALALPFEDSSIHSVVSFAVLHHITPKTNRQKFFAEIARVLKPGGTAYITVWNLYQPKYRHYLTQYYITKIRNHLLAPLNVAFGFGDCLIPFGEQKTLRYVHAFTPKELQHLARKYFDVLELQCTLKDGLTSNWQKCRNMCLVLKKR